MNILLIDDDKFLLKMLRLPLRDGGHSLTEAVDGRKGWDCFMGNPHHFDVIVTDLKMPVLSGVALLKRLREKGYEIPVIIISGYEDIQSSIEVLRLGAFDFLLKPFEANELLEILEKLDTVQENQKRQLQDLPFFTEDIRISIHSQTHLIPSAGAFLQDRVKLYCKMHRIDVRNIGLCLHEAMVNAVIHGNLEISSSIKNKSPDEFESLLRRREADPHYAERLIDIRCRVTTEQLYFEIGDEGKGFEPKELQFSDPALMIPSGRGILIITAFMDKVFWNERGNRVTMIKNLTPVLASGPGAPPC
ncbi:MAG: response regulator [bacterium]|nr:response regulator [bacterium]